MYAEFYDDIAQAIQHETTIKHWSRAVFKKAENHMAAVALFVAHYNLCRVHEATRMTPAMALGVTDQIWTVAEIVEAALEGLLPEPVGTPSRALPGN